MNNNFFFRLKEKLFKHIFILQDSLSGGLKWLFIISDFTLLICGLIFTALMITHLGFSYQEALSSNITHIVKTLFFVTYFAKYIQKILQKFTLGKTWAKWIDIVIFIVATIILIAQTDKKQPFILDGTIFTKTISVAIMLIILYITEIYKIFKAINSIKIAPALLFTISFLVLIFIGSGMLMLPEANNGNISYFDALFTSTSAVCVTGLTSVDLTTSFTIKGYTIIMLLFQMGGLGIMVFTGFFAYAFTGTISFKDRLLLKDIFSSETLGDIFKFLFKILFITILFESVGAVLIYTSVEGKIDNPIFFSIFHSISSFCNAGFSILPNGIADNLLADNNLFYLTVSTLVVLGGIGFPILIASYFAIKTGVFKLLNKSLKRHKYIKSIRSNISLQISLYTSLILIVLGAVIFYVFEYNNSLSSESSVEKWIISVFSSVSSRSAGFNIVDISQWRSATLFIIVSLAWIGASPGSTGGGIKTTTFAVMILAAYNFVRGRHNIVIGYNRIGSETISRVLVVVILSLLTIFAGFIGLMLVAPDTNPMHLLFETISAYSTLGLSVVGTPTLNIQAKCIVMALMFIGRVGPLTILSGILVSHRTSYFKVPEQDLTIN